MTLSVTILGCGSSGGVPRPALGWGDCDPTEPKNRRRRCSILVERDGLSGTTRLLVDTSPDLREQLLDAGVAHLDAVLFSHDHADHTHGIDDLRALALHNRQRVRVHADSRTAASLMQRFGYMFETPPGSSYPPVLDRLGLEAGASLTVVGAGGAITAWPVAVEHGPDYEALGFRFDGIGYLPDVSLIPPPARAALQDLDVLILDCLRETPHPSHFNLDQSLAAIAELRPRRAILTNLHSDLDYNRLRNRLPPEIDVAFDGMKVSMRAG
ncbi:MAG: MBL fold metallo-hydrolase [Bosea sp. (in: a-proteobacteria)]|uniref:MBL fold metallo-hydrolase n=1 Tax=Bosea sp. (in: a-proteobacteria) TaxID=1871050 RepID=UPI002736FCF9|nr:MBL fold metallo-hydrolase [Bosea sp. (in: a-proteobacteria)]MDP3255967.1 MBL fold metallo-hydrolase [Bosea sp. (in: a-proteobacteria)]MDP3318694.1 MBL fold metallo-hydrolase [Bosea sp. (in: a-proteobacteria)]